MPYHFKILILNSSCFTDDNRIASIIIIAFSLIAGTQNGIIMLVSICVINEASAAPDALIIGIRLKFSNTLQIAAPTYIYFKYFCLFSHTNHAPRATPKYEKAVYHVTIFNTEIDGA